MKRLIIDTIPFNVNKNGQVLESFKNSNGSTLVQGILATCEVKNGNGRYYSRELWEDNINRYQTLINENRAMGECDHSDNNIISLKNVSHKINKIWWDGDNIMGIIEILKTPSGNILKSLIDSGVTIGVSSRGDGELVQNGDLMEVKNYNLLCWDFVSTPSNPGSYTYNLNESLNSNTIINNKYNKLNSLITDIICIQNK